MIRRFTNSDLDSIMQIWVNENISAHSFIPKEYWQNNYEYVKSALPQAEIYVYETNNKINGFIGLNGDYIEGIFVNSDNQHKGTGTALLNEIKQKKNRLTLKVYEKNTQAIHFYKKNGFEILDSGIDHAVGEKEFTMLWRNEK